MIHYLLINSFGEVFQRGTCPSEDDIPAVPGMRAEIISEDDKRQPPQPPAPGYVEHRAMEYPPIGDQLDALWRVVQANNLAAGDPAAHEMLERVRTVKARHPKGKA